MKALTPTPAAAWIRELNRDPNLRSEQTRSQYSWHLRKFDLWRHDRPMTATLVEEYLTYLQRLEKSTNTIKQALAAVRWLAARAVKIAYEERPAEEARALEMEVNRIQAIKLKRLPKPLPAGRNVEDIEVDLLLQACDDGTLAGLRDGAFLAVAIATAARNEEIRNIKIADLTYNPDGAELLIPHGKGDKPRVVDLFGDYLARVTAWIEKRGVSGDHLFTRIFRGHAISTAEPLTYQGTRFMLEKRFKASALAQRMTWHDFRRTAIGKLLDANIDPATVMQITGHADFNTVKRYDRRGPELRKAALKLIQTRPDVGEDVNDYTKYITLERKPK